MSVKSGLGSAQVVVVAEAWLITYEGERFFLSTHGPPPTKMQYLILPAPK
jgi:hypothetical protein